MKKRSVRLNSKGFTLVELLVVIAILALLAGIGVPQVMRTLQRSRLTADLSKIDSIQASVNAWRAETGAYWWECTALTAEPASTTTYAQISLTDTDTTMKSLITGVDVTLKSMIEAGDFPQLRSSTVTKTAAAQKSCWYINTNGQVYYSEDSGVSETVKVPTT